MKSYIFIDQNIEDMKSKLATSKKPVYDRLINHCETYFNEDLPVDHPAASTTFMGLAMANLSLAYLLSGETRYFEEARRWIFTCVNYPHWGNAHLVDVDLSAAWILFGMGLCYDWLKEDFSEEEKEKVRHKILLQGNRMYDFKVKTEGSGWSTNFWQNHNWINMTGLAAAGYAIADEAPEAAHWITSARENFDFVYSVLPEDGSDYEGVVYWRYGAMWLFIYDHLIKEREGVDYFSTCSFLKNTFNYRLYQAAPNLEEQINFGDAHDRRSGHSTAIYYKTAAEYRNGYAQKLGNLVRDEFLLREAELSKVKPGILPECFFEMIFFDETVEELDFGSLPLRFYFDDLGLLVCRSSWEKDADHFSFKCSCPGGKKQWDWLWKLKKEKNFNCFGLSHQHPDNNSFLIHSGGEYFAIDDGYNRTVKASDHNLVLVDGRGFSGEGQNNIWKDYSEDMKASIESCLLEEDLTYAVGDSAPVYWKDLKIIKNRRHFIHTGKPWYIFMDELSSHDSHMYTWQMYSDVFPEVTGNQYSFRIKRSRMDLLFFCDLPTVTDTKENIVRAVMTTQEPDKYTENHMKGLCISNIDKSKDISFISVFIPGGYREDNCEITELKLEGAYGVSITDPGKDETDVFLFVKDGGCLFRDENIEPGFALLTLKGETLRKRMLK